VTDNEAFDVDTIRNWITGIERGIWNPTEATKRHLASLLRLWLLEHSEPTSR
jgi:hypothetical protein